ncbi:MAG: M36 family metallopeptidase, partial [Blastocatellia bacterium]
MKRVTIIALTLLFAATLSLIHSAGTSAIQSGSSGRTPKTRENFDLRINHLTSLDAPPAVDAATGSPDNAAARISASQPARLKQRRPSARIHWSSLSTTPSRIWSFTEPVTAPQRGDAETIARRFLKDNSDLFCLGDDQVDALRVTRRYQTEHNGLTHVTLGQQVNGIEIFQAEYAIHVDRDGAVLAASGELIPDASTRVNATMPRLTAEAALRIAAREVDEELTAPLSLRAQPAGSEQRQEFDRAAGFGDHVPARLAYFPLAFDEVRLAWRFIITMRETPDLYFVMIDADRGSLLFLHNLTCYDENPLKPHGQVYTKESPRPNLPRAGTNPPEVQREDLPFRAEPYNGAAIFPVSDPHYDWWAGAKADNLVSNNTTTYLDRDTTPNQPDMPRLAAADGNFNFPVDLTQPPTTENNQKAAQVNLFYWINRYHDILYSFGFNEAARNFQTDNFNLGGAANDPVRGEAQDGSGTNNANFSTPPDGGAGRVQMY